MEPNMNTEKENNHGQDFKASTPDSRPNTQVEKPWFSVPDFSIEEAEREGKIQPSDSLLIANYTHSAMSLDLMDNEEKIKTLLSLRSRFIDKTQREKSPMDKSVASAFIDRLETKLVEVDPTWETDSEEEDLISKALETAEASAQQTTNQSPTRSTEDAAFDDFLAIADEKMNNPESQSPTIRKDETNVNSGQLSPIMETIRKQVSETDLNTLDNKNRNANIEWARRNKSDIDILVKKGYLTPEDARKYGLDSTQPTSQQTAKEMSPEDMMESLNIPAAKSRKNESKTPSRNEQPNTTNFDNSEFEFDDDEDEEENGENDGKSKFLEELKEKGTLKEKEAYIRNLVEKVERQGDTQIKQLANGVKNRVIDLESLIKETIEENKETALPLELALEARASLRLHEMSVVLSFINKKSDEIKGDIGRQMEAVVNGGRLLTGEDFALLFRGTLKIDGPEGERYKNVEAFKGINVHDAYLGLQRAALEGVIVNGERIKYGQRGLTSTQERGIRQQIADQLGENGIRAVRLAERLTQVTFEKSVWNTEGGDFLAQAIYLKKVRSKMQADEQKDPSQATDEYGPNSTIDVIEGFGTSFMRKATFDVKDRTDPTKKSKVRLFNNAAWEKVSKLLEGKDKLSASTIARKLNSLHTPANAAELNTEQQILSRNGVQVDNNFDPAKADWEKLSGTAYSDYLTKYIPAVVQVKSLLMKSEWKPSDFGPKELKTWTELFTQSDPDSIFNLRMFFVAGALDESLKNDPIEQAGWSNVAAVKNLVSNLNGGKKPFLTNAQYDWVLATVKPLARSAWLDAQYDLMGIKQTR